LKELVAAKVDSYYNSNETGQMQIVDDVLSSLASEQRRFLEIAEMGGFGRSFWRDPTIHEQRRQVAVAFRAIKRIRELQIRMGKEASEKRFGAMPYEAHPSQNIQPPRKKQKTDDDQ